MRKNYRERTFVYHPREGKVQPFGIVLKHRELVDVFQNRTSVNVLQVDELTKVAIDVDHP
jgi:hypothetical protein